MNSEIIKKIHDHLPSWKEQLQSIPEDPVLFIENRSIAPYPLLIYENPDEEIEVILLEKRLSKIQKPKKEYKDTYAGTRISDQKTLVVSIYFRISEWGKLAMKTEEDLLSLVKNHLGFPEIYFLFRSQRKTVVIQKYYSEGNLLQYLLHHKLTQNDIALILLDLLQALHFLHQNGYVYTDFRLTNILVDSPKFHVILTDFGSICKIGSIRESNRQTIINLANYAPENINMRLKKQPYLIVSQTDIWGLGNLLYELIFSSPPPWDQYLRGKSNIQKALELMHLRKTFPEPKNPISLEHLCWEMLQENPNQRISLKGALEKIKKIINPYFSQNLG